MRTEHLVMPEDHMEELYSSRNVLVRFVHQKRLKALARRIPLRGATILDAGCGEGQLIECMHRRAPENSYHGSDITAVALEKARKRCTYAKFHRMDLAAMKFPDATFDVIVCTEVIEHIYEYRSVLNEFIRLLKPNGILLLTFPNEPLWTLARFLLGRRPIKVPDHVNSFTPRRMRREVPLRSSFFVGLPLRLPFFMSLNAMMEFRKRSVPAPQQSRTSGHP
ncbi:class I SAM-dependent methyltransferase [Candidatus Woesearchaeota archaeon]|nr:class I SAM-dependent methyltransferase [Candidatus Woesearchaeota archaeon]